MVSFDYIWDIERLKDVEMNEIHFFVQPFAHYLGVHMGSECWLIVSRQWASSSWSPRGAASPNLQKSVKWTTSAVTCRFHLPCPYSYAGQCNQDVSSGFSSLIDKWFWKQKSQWVCCHLLDLALKAWSWKIIIQPFLECCFFFNLNIVDLQCLLVSGV